MMPEGDRLRRLHMGEARHDGIGMGSGLREQARVAARPDSRRRGAGVAHPQPKIGRDLVVARTRGVQPARRFAHDLGEPRFDIEMDVLECALEDKFAVDDFALDPCKTSKNLHHSRLSR